MMIKEQIPNIRTDNLNFCFYSKDKITWATIMQWPQKMTLDVDENRKHLEAPSIKTL